MKKAKVLENLKSLSTELRSSDFASFREVCALDKVIRKMEKRRNEQADREGKYTVVFAYPEELTDGKLQACVEFVLAGSIDEAKQKACGLRGITVIAVFKGHRESLYSEV